MIQGSQSLLLELLSLFWLVFFKLFSFLCLEKSYYDKNLVQLDNTPVTSISAVSDNTGRNPLF